MRPPLNAGEDDNTATLGGLLPEASMRPPLNAGEDHQVMQCLEFGRTLQ